MNPHSRRLAPDPHTGDLPTIGDVLGDLADLADDELATYGLARIPEPTAGIDEHLRAVRNAHRPADPGTAT